MPVLRLLGISGCTVFLGYAETLDKEEESITSAPSIRSPAFQVIAEESTAWEMKLAPSLLGVLMGLLLAVAHVPGSPERRAQGRVCKVVSCGILFLQSAYIVEFQWHFLYTPNDCKGRIRYRWLSMIDCCGMVLLGLYCAVKPHPTSGYVYDALWCVYGFAATSLLLAGC